MIQTVTHFTPLAALLGGMLIGLSATLMMLHSGRIAGISGIAARLIPPWEDKETPARLGFVLGLIAAPALVTLVTGRTISQSVPDDLPMMLFAGLLVGFGSIWGSGCTSGHGVCGLARLSLRSLIAIVTLLLSAGLTVFVLRHLIGG